MAIGLVGILGCRDPQAAQTAEAVRLLDADRAFAAKSVKDGAAAAFFSVMTAQSMRLPSSGQPITGREEVRARLTSLPPQVLDWTPMKAEVARSLDLGWTWGEWRLLADVGSHRIVARGKYLNVWKRGADGLWQLAVDIGNESPDPTEATPVSAPVAPPSASK
jgi:ketosteroid isomerase-like protein